MKRTAAILLCALLLFNWTGYRLLISYMQDSANVKMEAQLDNNNYDESELISIKIPAIHLSSYSHAGEFERVDGQVEIKGIQYKYVKKRLFNDSLEYLCMPDHNTLRLQSAKNEFFCFVNDLKHCGQQTKSDSHAGSFKALFSKYLLSSSDLFIKDAGITTSQNLISSSPGLPQTILRGIEHPPEFPIG